MLNQVTREERTTSTISFLFKQYNGVLGKKVVIQKKSWVSGS